MNKKYALVAFAAVVLMAAGCSKSSTTNTNTSNGSEQKTEQSTTSSSATQGEVKTFTVNGDNFKFDVKEIKVKKGDKVKIVFNNTGGFHDWVVDEFNARTPQIQGNNTATVEFTADKTGTFEYYCSVGQHRQMGMKGNLIVE